MQRNNSRNGLSSSLTTIDAPLTSINTTSATVVSTNSGLPPLLLRRSNSSTIPSDNENPVPNIPIADEDPGDRALSVSSHERKTSGIPLEAEAVVRRDSKIFTDNLGLILDGDEEEGPGAPPTPSRMMEFDDIQPESLWSGVARSSARSILSQPKQMGMLALGVFGINVWLWARRPSEDAVVWSLALTLLVTPYVWSWDFVMLVPLMVWAISHLESEISRALTGLGYVAIWGLMVWIRLHTDGSDHRLWWVPWLTAAIVYVGYLMDARSYSQRRVLDLRRRPMCVPRG